MTGEQQGFRRLQDRMWPGFLLVAVGVSALWWHRSAADQTALFAKIVFFSIPVLLIAGILLLLRALKLKEQAVKEAEARQTSRAVGPAAGSRAVRPAAGSATGSAVSGRKKKRKGWTPEEAPTDPSHRP